MLKRLTTNNIQSDKRLIVYSHQSCADSEICLIDPSVFTEMHSLSKPLGLSFSFQLQPACGNVLHLKSSSNTVCIINISPGLHLHDTVCMGVRLHRDCSWIQNLFVSPLIEMWVSASKTVVSTSKASLNNDKHKFYQSFIIWVKTYDTSSSLHQTYDKRCCVND